MTTLKIDLSDTFIALALGEDRYLSDIKSQDLWDSTDLAAKALKDFLKLKGIGNQKTVYFVLPIKMLNYQVVTLPEKIKEREKKVLLGLELDKSKFATNFNYKKLDITLRDEDGSSLCDYMVLGAKRGVHEKLLALAKSLNFKQIRAVPSFMLFVPRVTERLSATAYVGEDRTEIAIWGSGFPLAVAAIPNTGDQMEDINRFINGYFDKVENLDLTNIRLYGPKMRDAALAFSLNYPNEIINDPAHAIAAALYKAEGQLDVLIKTKLPNPPIAMTPRNMVFFLSFVALIGLISYTSYLGSNTNRYRHELKRLSKRAEHMKLIYAAAKRLDGQKLELETERDFYLKITKRRTPWHMILFDLGDLTPRNLWFERFNSTKNTVMIAGKATTPEDVAALSLNLSNSSRYFEEAQVMGMRDYKESDKVYTEFQLTAKLKSPLTKIKEEAVEAKPVEATLKPGTKTVKPIGHAGSTAAKTNHAALPATSTKTVTASNSTGVASKTTVAPRATSTTTVHTTATTSPAKTSASSKAAAVKAASKAYHAVY